MSRTRMSVKSGCYPSCDLSLPRIGTVSILSRLDVCKSPAILTLSVMSDGRRSLNTFVAGNQQQEVRTIGNEYWPMHLRVSFSRVEHYDEYFAEACIETVRTGNISCFMNGFLPLESGATNCSTHKSESNFPIVLLCIILATCFLMIGITVTISLVQKFCSSSSKIQVQSSKNRKRDFGKKQHYITGYPLMLEQSTTGCPKFITSSVSEDERLTVIAETSECHSSSYHLGSEASLSGVESAAKSISESTDLARSNPLLTVLNMKNSQSYQPENQLKPPCNITHSTTFLQSFK